MAEKSWNRLEWTGKGRNRLEQAGKGCNRLEKTGIGSNRLKQARIGWNWLELSVIAWNRLKQAKIRQGKPYFFSTQASFDPKLFYPQKKCVNYDKSEFVTKQRKIYLTASMSKVKIYQIIAISAKSQHNSLLQHNSVKFAIYSTQAVKTLTQALLARLYVFHLWLKQADIGWNRLKQAGMGWNMLEQA